MKLFLGAKATSTKTQLWFCIIGARYTDITDQRILYHQGLVALSFQIRQFY